MAALLEDELIEELIFSQLSSDEIAGILYESIQSRGKRVVVSNAGLLNLDGLTEVEARQMFRFEKGDLDRLRNGLRIPDAVRNTQGISISGTEALCIALRRLAYPNRLCDLQREFSRSVSTLSLFCSQVTAHIVQTFGRLLEDFRCNAWLTQEALRTFASAVHQKGAPLQNCWGFIDGTARAMCRPTSNQADYFSGHKRCHGLKYQAVMCPNGIITHLHGPHQGRRHDAGIFRASGLYGQLESLMERQPFVLYGDPAYPLRPLLMKPFGGATLTEDQKLFNELMSSVRQCVEWGFGKVVTEFAFTDFKKNQKLLLQDIATMHKAAVLLTNCHTCLYGSQTSTYFRLQPSLEQYLAFPM